MSENKRYYFLQMPENFFQSKRIKKLRSLAGGDTFTIIYLKMQLKAMNNHGILEYSGIEDEIAKEIAMDIDEGIDNVRLTMDYLIRVGLLEVKEDGNCYLPYAEVNVGSITASTIRSQKSRGKKALQCNIDATNCNGDIDIDIDKDINTSKKVHQQEVDELFESLWKLYIRKEGKSQVNKKAKEEIFNIGYDRMKLSIEKYAKEKQNTDKQYLLMGSTFFNGRYKDYLPPESQEKPIEPTNTEDVINVSEMSDEEWEEYVQSEEWENN